MSETDVPDYLPQFTDALMKAGATRSSIRSFAAYWKALPPAARKLPCPLCYAEGHQGWLIAVIDRGRVRSVQCDRCWQEIIVSGPPH